MVSRGQSVAEAVRSIGVTQVTRYRWRKEFGGLKTDQVTRLEDLEKENERLRKAVSALTLEKLILGEAASGHFRAPPAVPVSTTSGRSSRCRNGSPVAGSGSIARRNGRCRADGAMKTR